MQILMHSCVSLVLLVIFAVRPPTSGPSTAPAATAPNASARAATAPAGEQLRVMSFNVRFGTANDGANDWAHRKRLLLRTIDAFAPDLLGTQELLAFQADELREHLGGYEFAGVGRDDGNQKGEFAGLFYRADRFERVTAGNFWLSEHPDQAGSVSWDSALTRIASWVKLREKRAQPDRDKPARMILWLNTHFDHRGPVARRESASLLRRQIARLHDDPAMAVIVTGDLNCAEDSEPYRVLVGRDDAAANEPVLIDSYREAHPQRHDDEASFHGFKGARAGSRIDFILHNRQLETAAASIDRSSDNGLYPSDHYPVTAVLTWK